MTGPTCGTPHYRYTESLCTEPARHYVRERDPHAAPLIIDGRQCGGLAWDEPEHHMPDRHTVNSITSDALDQLYADLDHARQHAAALDAPLHAQLQAAIKALGTSETELAHLRSQHARVQALVDEYPVGLDTALLEEALDQTAPAATGAHVYLSTGCLHDQHDYCQSHTGQAGAKTPAQCKFCQAPCTCPCHKETPGA